MAKDHVKRQKGAFVQIAVARQCVDGQNLKGVIKKQHVAGNLRQTCPAGGFEEMFNLAGCRRFPMILRLADDEGNVAVLPLDDRVKLHPITIDIVSRDPS